MGKVMTYNKNRQKCRQNQNFNYTQIYDNFLELK